MHTNAKEHLWRLEGNLHPFMMWVLWIQFTVSYSCQLPFTSESSFCPYLSILLGELAVIKARDIQKTSKVCLGYPGVCNDTTCGNEEDGRGTLERFEYPLSGDLWLTFCWKYIMYSNPSRIWVIRKELLHSLIFH